MDIIDQGGKIVIECVAHGSVMVVCCGCMDTEYMKTLIPDIPYNLLNTMTGEGEGK